MPESSSIVAFSCDSNGCCCLLVALFSSCSHCPGVVGLTAGCGCRLESLLASNCFVSSFPSGPACDWSCSSGGPCSCSLLSFTTCACTGTCTCTACRCCCCCCSLVALLSSCWYCHGVVGLTAGCCCRLQPWLCSGCSSFLTASLSGSAFDSSSVAAFTLPSSSDSSGCCCSAVAPLSSGSHCPDVFGLSRLALAVSQPLFMLIRRRQLFLRVKEPAAHPPPVLCFLH